MSERNGSPWPAPQSPPTRSLTWGAPDPAKKADTATVEKTHAEMRGRTAYWQTWDATGGDEKEARRQKLIATLAPVPERADNPPTEGQRWSKAQTKPPAPPKPDDRFGDAYTWTAYTTSTDDPPAPKRVRAAAKYTAGQLRTYVGLQRIRFEKQGSWHAPWPERRLDAVNPLHSAKCQARGAWGNALVQKPTPGCKGCKALR